MRKALAGLISTIALLTACNGPAPAPTPTQSAGAGGSNEGSPGELRLNPNWLEVSREVHCTPPGNEPLCIDDRITIDRDGNYRFDGRSSSGTLQKQELVDLTAAANVVASEGLGDPESCQGVFSIPEIGSVLVAITPESTRVETDVLSRDRERGECVHGDRDLADRLSELMDRLMREYAGVS